MYFETIETHQDHELQDEKSLKKLLKADLIVLCQERGISIEGTKQNLLDRLVEWKNEAKPVPAPSSPKLMTFSFETLKKTGMMDCDEEMAVDKTSLRKSSKNIPSQWFESIEELCQIDLRELVIKQKLGSGGFKDCYEGVYKNERVAIGIIKITNFTQSEYTEITHEINVLKQLRHENIVRFIGVCFQKTINKTNLIANKINEAMDSNSSSKFCIVTELCSNGDLYDYMHKTDKPGLSEQVMLMHDIALGVAYLHTRRPSIIHRDLKSMNVLVDENNRAKINDFGLARIRPKGSTIAHTNCGTPNWQAPEFWTSKPSYNEKVDVYSCGLIFWEIMQWHNPSHPYPFYKMTEHELYENVRDKGMRPSMSNLSKYPQVLLDLVKRMWHTDPELRPSMNSVLETISDLLS